MSLELLTVLDKDGKAQKGKDPNLPAAELQKLYRLMVATRALDERVDVLPRQGRHLEQRQEPRERSAQLVRDIGDEVSAGLGQPDMSRAVTGRDNGVAVIIERTDSHGENEVGPRGGPFHLHGVDDVAPLAPGSTHQFEQSLVSDT